MTTRKYEFVTNDTVVIAGAILTRIRALTDIQSICKAGDLGGYIEKEENLSHEDTCWVTDNARVYGDAKVYGNAKIYGNAQVYGNAKIYGDAYVHGNAEIYGGAQVYGHAFVSGNTQVYGNSRVSGYAWIFGNAAIFGNAKIYGNAQVYGNAKIYGDACVSGNAKIDSDAEVSERHHVVWFSNVGSENGTLTVFKTKDGVKVTRGCFTGTPEEFLGASKAKHDDIIHEEYKALVTVAVGRVTR